ncbi:MAG TPA: hypoxanthine phosphoribosyltransferase [bacterium (Candidatus Stahlbacteria)]|nr:hypoxanthine phosphoribosyltransferase [Candidatus Stahlbacteria bacterium]
MPLDNPAELNVLITEVEIRERIDQLVGEIGADFQNQDPVVVGLLTGSFIFLADLIRGFFRHNIRPEVDFMIVSSYKGVRSSGKVEVIQDIKIDIDGRSILLVDDILDTGRTLSLVCNHLRSKGPTRLKTCVFLNKRDGREVDFTADYVGFVIPDLFVVGYGLDLEGRFRELPYVAEVR